MKAQHQSMIITSSGILFCTARDGKIYALDVDTGKQLWSYDLPRNTVGIPTMYELNGKHYLAVCATASLRFGRVGDYSEDPNAAPAEPPPSNKGAYVVFALPDKK